MSVHVSSGSFRVACISVAMMPCPCFCCSFEGNLWAIHGSFSLSGALQSRPQYAALLEAHSVGAMCVRTTRYRVPFRVSLVSVGTHLSTKSPSKA